MRAVNSFPSGWLRTLLPGRQLLYEHGEHPDNLVEADRRYIVPWGQREVGLVLFLTVVFGAAIGAITLLTGSPRYLLALVPLVAAAAFLALFFRNPLREIPAGPGLLVAPADGTVWDVCEVEETEYIKGRCVRVGIFLSVFNVHLNRAPTRGRVEWTAHREGSYHDARSAAATRENESTAIGILREDAGGPQGVRILVKQIAGAIARRIVCPVEPPQAVARGGLLGMIKYGSRTELYVPLDPRLKVLVREGERVKAGSTVIAAWAD